MKTVKNRLNFLVLVPHKDTRGILQKMESIPGSYTFPCVAPLASLCKPLSSDELKHIARSIREAKGIDKFELTDFACTAFPTGSDKMNLYGPKLDLVLSPSIFEAIAEKIKTIFSPVLIGTSLLPKANEQQLCDLRAFVPLCEVPLLNYSFRAAAVANMYWQPCLINNEKVFKWKIDKLVWLPKKI